MPAVQQYQRLQCLQLVSRLRLGVCEILRRPLLRRDLRYVDHLRRAADGSAEALAEALRAKPEANALGLLERGRAWLARCQRLLRDGADRGYLTATECAHLIDLARRADDAAAAIHRQMPER